jgi:hypothetical protein
MDLVEESVDEVTLVIEERLYISFPKLKLLLNSINFAFISIFYDYSE